MSRSTLRPLQALLQGVRTLRQQPRLAFGFSALSCGVHLLGWALVAIGEASDSAVLTLMLRAVGGVVYAGSLLWLIEGLTRIGLALSAGHAVRWRQLCRWHGRRSRDLALGLLNTGMALGAAAFAAFVAWSLTLFLLPGFSLVPALLGGMTMLTVALSQLFNPCLVLDQKLSPSQAFSGGWLLLRQHGAGTAGLGVVVVITLLTPFVLGLLSEALVPGRSAIVTVVLMVAALPLLATTITAAYRQLDPIRPAAR